MNLYAEILDLRPLKKCLGKGLPRPLRVTVAVGAALKRMRAAARDPRVSPSQFVRSDPVSNRLGSTSIYADPSLVPIEIPVDLLERAPNPPVGTIKKGNSASLNRQPAADAVLPVAVISRARLLPTRA